MTQTIKAIQTSYRNRRFRSRLEARYAVFLDQCNVDWDYEREGFDLGKELGWYLPDFYLTRTGWYLEIKPFPTNESSLEYRRCAAFAKAHRTDVWMAFDFEDSTRGALAAQFSPDGTFEYRPIHWLMIGYDKAIPRTSMPMDYVRKAIKTAMRARFEHGE